MSRNRIPTLALLACLVAFIYGCKSPTLTVMTFNIRYDTPSDGPNAWPKRRALVSDLIKKHDPDVIGLQEVLASQRDALIADLPGYAFVGVGRDDGADKGEFAPVLFKEGRFQIVDKGWFWLSDAPSKPGSRGWDAACPRMATWVILNDATHRQQLFVVNTHLDHKGDVARRESAKMIAALLGRNSELPQIVTGDFNCAPTHSVHQTLLGTTSTSPLKDAYSQMHADETDAGTFNGFEGVRTGSRIDWILHSADFTPISCSIDQSSAIERYPSDHFPVIARFRISSRR